MTIQLFNEDNLRLLEEFSPEDIDLVVTDPPYNRGYRYDGYYDKLPDNEYISVLARLRRFNKVVIIHYAEETIRYVVPALGTPDKVIAWVYNGHRPKRFRLISCFGFVPKFERVLQEFKNQNDPRIKAKIAKGFWGVPLYDWWHIEQVKNVSREKTGHPCQIPLQVMSNIVLTCSDEGETVLDPFMGSGTVGVACVNHGRNFIGIEISETYYQIANERLGL